MTPPLRFSTLFYERWFAAMQPNYRGDVNCVLEFDGRLNKQRLQQAFLAALAAEPMWSYRFVEHWWTPYWQHIPRSDRPGLFRVEECADDAARVDAWNRILDTPVDAAARVTVLRTPANDQLLLRVDHCLADANAARCLVESIAENYQQEAPVPSHDGPVIRRTMRLLRPLKNWRERLKFLSELVRFAKRSISGRGFVLPSSTEADPCASPRFLHYPGGATEQLSRRSMSDRATSAMVVMAVSYIALRDLVSFDEQTEWPILLPVNLRRYLPAEQQRAPACFLAGQVAVWIKHREAADLPAVLQQVRSQLADQRGPNFGLVQSPLALDVPLLRLWTHRNPFAWTRRNFQRMNENPAKTPMVLISDLGEFGKSGDDWGSATVTNGYCTQGTFRNPSIMIGVSSCGTRLTLAVGSGPQSFVRRFAERIDYHLSRYVGWAPLLATTANSGSSA